MNRNSYSERIVFFGIFVIVILVAISLLF